MTKEAHPKSTEIGLVDFNGNCNRGIAVFTRGLNFQLGNNNTLSTGMWPWNHKRVQVGDCIVVYHRIGIGANYTSVVYVGRITKITPANDGLFVYQADQVTATNIQDVNWKQFAGCRSRVRYF
jgi:hypothetical protein